MSPLRHQSHRRSAPHTKISHGRSHVHNQSYERSAPQRERSREVSSQPTLAATQGQILSQSPTDATSGNKHLNGSWQKKPSICLWVVFRVIHEPRDVACPHQELPDGDLWYEQLLYRNGQWFRSGLVFKAHRLLYHSTLVLRAMPSVHPTRPARARHASEGSLKLQPCGRQSSQRGVGAISLV